MSIDDCTHDTAIDTGTQINPAGEDFQLYTCLRCHTTFKPRVEYVYNPAVIIKVDTGIHQYKENILLYRK